MLRFAVVGGLGVVVNSTALYVLYRLADLPLTVASALAVELAVIHNYLLNDWWTFAARAPSMSRFMKFNVVALGGLSVNVFLVWALSQIGMHFLLANGVGIAAGFALNFTLSAVWVWSRGET